MTSNPSSSAPDPRKLLARRCAIGIASLALSACASFNGIGSHAHVASPADYASARTLPPQQGQWPDLSWVGSIGGAPLQALVDEALAGNPNLQAAAARVDAARAMAEATRIGAHPTIGAGFSATYQRYTENGLIPPPLGGQIETDSQLALNFSYDFDFWGRHADELRAALSQGKAAEAELYNARLILTSAIARGWVQLARQQAHLDLAEQQIALREKLDRLIQLRVKAGLETQNETQQARLQMAGLRNERLQWQEAIALTRNQIAALMGQGPDRGLRIQAAALPGPSVVALPDALPLGLLGRRPDIVAARWRVEAAQGQIGAAKAQFYPDVNLTAFAGFSSLGLSKLLESGSRMAGIGPAIHLPFFQQGSLRANLKGKVAGYDAAVASYNQALVDALHDVADQVQSLRAADAQNAELKIAIDAAQSSLNLARQRERVGTANTIPRLAAEMALLQQRKAEIDLRAREAELHVGLIKALGGGFDAGKQDLAAGTAPNAS